MAHGKETPRQKMIGMMYLVLTALLALNVSAEVLNAFVLVDESLMKTGENFKKKNELVYTEFQEAYTENKEKVGPYKEKADQVKIWSNELIDYIHELKLKMIKIADGSTQPFEEHGPSAVKAKSENNIPGQVMVLEKNGQELKTKIEDFRSNLLGMIDDKERYASVVEGIQASLNTDDIETTHAEGTKVPWEIGNFDQLPLSAVLTMLSKMQSDIRNAEADILRYLFGQIEAGSFKFNKIEAIVNANSNYVLKGQEYKAEVFIAASDSTQDPEIIVNGSPLNVKNGKGVYVGNTSSVGFKKWGGVIKLESPSTGEILKFPFDAEYQVGQAGVVVSPTKMNVFYIGVTNPVEISASGVPAENIRASISSGSINKVSGSSYAVKVKRPGKVNINVSAEMSDGTTKSMGRKEFRVKYVPDPVAKVAGMKGGTIRKNVLLAQRVVSADLENFDFDLKFTISSFSVSTTIRGYEEEEKSRSAAFTAKQKALIKKVSPGKKVYIEDIRARGPGGTSRKLPTISFRVQ